MPDLYYESLLSEVQVCVQRLAKEKLAAASVSFTDLTEENGAFRFERRGLALELKPLNDQGAELTAQILDELCDFVEYRINSVSPLGIERSVSSLVDGIVQRLIFAGELSECCKRIFRDKSIPSQKQLKIGPRKDSLGALGDIVFQGPLKLPEEFFAVEGEQLTGRIRFSVRENAIEVKFFEAYPPNPLGPQQTFPFKRALGAGLEKLPQRLQNSRGALDWQQALEQAYWETLSRVTLPFESREDPELARSFLVWKGLLLTRGISHSQRDWIFAVSSDCLERLANEQGSQAATRRAFFQLLRAETAEPTMREKELERFNEVAIALGFHRRQDPTVMYNPAFLYRKLVNQPDWEKEPAYQSLGMEFHWFLRLATLEQLVHLMKL